MDLYEDISDDDFEEFSQFDDYMGSLTDEEFAKELAFIEAVATAVQEGKNVVPNPARQYDFMM